MHHVRSWVMVVLAVLLVLGLLRYARGPEHHRGDDVGAWGPLTSQLERR